MLRKEQDLFDNRKISILPLIITIMVTIIVELVVHSVTLSVFKQRQESDHIYNATLLSEKITQNYEYEELLLESLDNELLSVASVVIDNRSLLSNEFLAEIATHFSSKYIYIGILLREKFYMILPIHMLGGLPKRATQYIIS